jgi:arylsulfatase A-like enzyme
MSTRPNVLFVFTDQQTRNAMNVAGNPWVRTPHMDSLARNGMLFRNAYCTSPVCVPSRASVVTGRMPHETGVEHNGLPLPAQFPTLGEVFRAAGYETAWAGTWQLSDARLTDENAIRGFRNLVLPPSPRNRLGTISDDLVADRAIEFIRQKRRQPFLLGVSLLNPHDICYWIMERDGDVLDPFLPKGDLPPLPANFEADPDEPEFIQICRRRGHYGNEQQWTKNWDERRWRTYLAVYYRMVEHVDMRLSRILEALRASGLEENTVIIFTSDHGEGMAAHRWVVKLMLYEETAGVPFVTSGPGIRRGVVSDHISSGIDIMPTLCDYAGVEPPPGLHGQSLRPVFEGTTVPRREFVVTELLPDLKRTELKGRMLRTQRFKYLVFSHGARPEMLFDLANDPGETKNLAVESGYRGELQRHRLLLEGWMKQTADPFRYRLGEK